MSPPLPGQHSGRATPSRVTPRQRHTTISTGRGSTYRGRNTVSTKPATSHLPRPRAQGKCHLNFGEGCHLYMALTGIVGARVLESPPLLDQLSRFGPL